MSGLYLFAIGNQLHNGCIPVFRLGGHRENMKLAGNAHPNRKQSRLTIQSLQHIQQLFFPVLTKRTPIGIFPAAYARTEVRQPSPVSIVA
jgi:hypothetical protein